MQIKPYEGFLIQMSPEETYGKRGHYWLGVLDTKLNDFIFLVSVSGQTAKNLAKYWQCFMLPYQAEYWADMEAKVQNHIRATTRTALQNYADQTKAAYHKALRSKLQLIEKDDTGPKQ